MKSLGRFLSFLHIAENTEKGLLDKNRQYADTVADKLEDKDVKAVNLMGATGSGKTTLIEKTVEKMKDINIGVVAGDIDADMDAERFKEKGLPVEAVNTGKECHLDAHLVQHAVEGLNLEEIDLLFFENVGNLICPVDFELGSTARVVMVSTTEGDDVVEKHPMIFKTADLAVVNKSDIAEAVGSNLEKMEKDAEEVGSCKALTMSLKEEENMEKWLNFLEQVVEGGN
ncbi:MAG: hydrogenase nickel incorporation protein HypB [Candidatus Nanohalobium sp.]